MSVKLFVALSFFIMITLINVPGNTTLSPNISHTNISARSYGNSNDISTGRGTSVEKTNTLLYKNSTTPKNLQSFHGSIDDEASNNSRIGLTHQNVSSENNSFESKSSPDWSSGNLNVGLQNGSLIMNISLHMNISSPEINRTDVWSNNLTAANVTTYVETKGHNEGERIETKPGKGDFKSHVIKAAIALQMARIHVRGTKTSTGISKAIEFTTKVLKNMQISFDNVTARKTFTQSHVCSEIYMGSTHGFPLYKTGYVTLTNCSAVTSLTQIVTLLLVTNDCPGSVTALRRIRAFSRSIPTAIVFFGCGGNSFMQKLNDLKVMDVTACKDGALASTLNRIIATIETKFVLILRNVVSFDINDVRLERLVREIELLGVRAVGGATRDVSGYWKMGCYQREGNSHGAIFTEGYDESLHDCVLCDYTDSPFLARTNEVRFDKKIGDELVFVDYFLQLNREIAVCPDSLFTVSQSIYSVSDETGRGFLRKWNLYKLQIYNETSIVSSCWQNVSFSCDGKILHPCCLEELSKLNRFILRICADSKLQCELVDHNLIGALIFKRPLPWKHSSSFGVSVDHFPDFAKLKIKFTEAGYGFKLRSVNATSAAINECEIRSKHWVSLIKPVRRVGPNVMTTKPTLLTFDGKVVIGPRNPGLAARNQLRRNVFMKRYLEIN